MKECNRYIQIDTPMCNIDVFHYEYHSGYVSLHIEENNESGIGYRYNKIVKYLREKTLNDSELKWEPWQGVENRECVLNGEKIQTTEMLLSKLDELIRKFDAHLEECKKFIKPDSAAEYNLPECNDNKLDNSYNNEDVSLMSNIKIEELFSCNLNIPDYQRIYCWNDENIIQLWNSLNAMPDKPYHLGAIILQKKDDKYEIIDGQQRLVTLTLILRALGSSIRLPLLKQKFLSQEACDNIANAKYIIDNLCNSKDGDWLKNNIEKNVIFTVLILNSSNLDLAYTFFSNQNSKGVKLSDYDILKAHHLRYILIEEQAEHLARKWNSLLQQMETPEQTFMEKTLGVHLYRLRKWLRKHTCHENTIRPVKKEFSAAPIIKAIPPFGEKFVFNEKIQGGTHFFFYTENFIEIYRNFCKIPQVRLLRYHLSGESHWKYESVIESFLFGYYMKFGIKYISEALFVICGVVAQHRYATSHAQLYKIHEHAQNSELIMMIEQASSPTFLLAEGLSAIMLHGGDLETNNIQKRFYHCLKKIFKGLAVKKIGSEDMSAEETRIAEFTETTIKEMEEKEYER